MSQFRSARLATRPAPRRATADAVAVPALRLVDQVLPRRRALTRAVTVLASALASVGLFGVVCLHVFLTQGQAQLDALHARADAATARNGQLTVDVAQLEAPARVVGLARQRLGMVPLGTVVYLPAVDPAAALPPVPPVPLPPSAVSQPTGTAAGTPTTKSSPAAAAATKAAATPRAAPPTKKVTSTTTVARHPTPPTTVAARPR